MAKFDLPNAADYEKQNLPPDVRAKINKRSSQKGGAYERDIGKKIAAYHNMEWTQAFLKTKRTTGGQPHGDLMPIMEMSDIWRAAGLGPIECKNRKEWAFNEIFKRPNTCTLFKYWLKSNEDCSSDNSIIFFTKPGLIDYVLLREDSTTFSLPCICFTAIDPKAEKKYSFKIITLDKFLTSTWVR